MTTKTRHVLLVEDSPDERELFQLAFDQIDIPYQMHVAEDGQQAIDYFLRDGKFAGQDSHHKPDIIFLDLKLPKLSGFEVIKLIRENPKAMYVPIVVFTSSSIRADVLASYQFGANSIVTKPVNSEQFTECVKLLGNYWLTWNYPHPSE